MPAHEGRVKIVADENIPLLSRFFGDFGELVSLPGRQISADDVADADVLLVRSVTRVNSDLLEGSKVRFVGTCTIGTDHIDLDYLSSKSIQFQSAPGANANSVVEYVLSCLSVMNDTHSTTLAESKVGIIGYGNIGSRLHKVLTKLGVRTCVYDPLLNPETIDIELNSFEEVLACDVITLHVPYTEDGAYPTRYMLAETELSSLSAAQTLINTSRGGVIDEQALKARIDQGNAPTVILDVWENEPSIDVDLAQRVYLGTPHIAGYSFDGKVAGTEMIYRFLCQFIGLPARHSSGQFLEEPPLSKMAFTSNADTSWCLHTAIRACFDVRHDHGQLIRTLGLSPEARSRAFDHLRKNYRCRREFSGVKIQLKQGDSELFSRFKALGFNIKS